MTSHSQSCFAMGKSGFFHHFTFDNEFYRSNGNYENLGDPISVWTSESSLRVQHRFIGLGKNTSRSTLCDFFNFEFVRNAIKKSIDFKPSKVMARRVGIRHAKELKERERAKKQELAWHVVSGVPFLLARPTIVNNFFRIRRLPHLGYPDCRRGAKRRKNNKKTPKFISLRMCNRSIIHSFI